MAEPAHHQGPVRGPSPLQKQGLLQMEIKGMEEELPPGVAERLLCPLF